MSALAVPPDVAEHYTGIQYRRATVEALDATQRIISMRCVPYGTETELAPGLFEVFDAKTFSRSAKDPGRIKLYLGHSNDSGRVCGHAFEADDRPDGVYLQTRVSKTDSGDELLTLAEDGVLDEASIEFAPDRSTMVVRRRGEQVLVRHRRGTLRGVALVPHGAYGREALVTSVRDDGPDPAQEAERLRLEALERLRALTH